MAVLKKIIFGLLSLLHQAVGFFSNLAAKLFPRLTAQWNTMQLTRRDNKTKTITHKVNGKETQFSFYTPNALALYRAETFSSKEPETLNWIDTYAPMDGVFFDIGANVGLYSVYHAKTKHGTTYAFEPSVFNVKLLAKNIYLNGCQDKVHIVTNPLTAYNSFADFNLQSTDDGGALSSFGVDYGHDGKKMNTRISYKTLGFSLDFLIDQKLVTQVPNLIKVDVDGIEHLILRGAQKTLAHPSCVSVLIEVNDSFTALASEVDTILLSAGFVLLEKKSVDADASSPGDNYTFNQIWLKK